MWLRRASIASLESGRVACSSGEGRSSLSMRKKREFRELSACQRTLVLFLFLASLLHAFTCLHHALETSARHPRYFGRDTLPAIASREVEDDLRREYYQRWTIKTSLCILSVYRDAWCVLTVWLLARLFQRYFILNKSLFILPIDEREKPCSPFVRETRSYIPVIFYWARR